MFHLCTAEEILDRLERKERSITHLDKLSYLNAFYLRFLANYEGVEVTPDIAIFGYEEALKENRYLANLFPNISAELWKIGSTGQGDEWFMNKEDGNMLFYNHDEGEYASIPWVHG